MMAVGSPTTIPKVTRAQPRDMAVSRGRFLRRLKPKTPRIIAMTATNSRNRSRPPEGYGALIPEIALHGFHGGEDFVATELGTRSLFLHPG